MDPVQGPAGGGPLVTIRGSGFQPGVTASVGGQALLDLVYVDATTLRGRLPAHAPGDEAVLVRNPDGATALLPAGFKVVPDNTGPLLILDARAWPNPSPAFLGLKLSMDAERVLVRAWSPAYASLGSLEVPGREGWQQIPLDGLLRGLPNGLCYLTVEARQGLAHTPPGPPLRVVLLR